MGMDANRRKSLMQEQRSLGNPREEKAKMGVSLIKQDLQLSKSMNGYNYQQQKD